MRRKRVQQDSLELFLDTICNMFGGFIFIMLFVVVSIRSATSAQIAENNDPNAPRVTDSELIEEREKLERLEVELERLETNLASSEEFNAELVSQESADRYNEAVRIKTEAQELRKKNIEAQELLAQDEDSLMDAKRENKKYRDLIDAAREALQDAKAMKMRSTSPPKLEPTFKNQIPIVLRFGRLYFWHKYDDNGHLVDDFNDEDFFAKERADEDGVLTEAKPTGGIDLTAPDVEERLDRAIKRFDKSRFYFPIVVGDDSFSEYNVVSSYLKKNGYGLHPFLDVKGEVIVDRGGRGGNRAQ